MKVVFYSAHKLDLFSLVLENRQSQARIKEEEICEECSVSAHLLISSQPNWSATSHLVLSITPHGKVPYCTERTIRDMSCTLLVQWFSNMFR